jgi:hypothetical protein
MWDDDPVRHEAETEALLERVSDALRREAVMLDPELDRRVMAAIRRAPRGRVRALVGWWLRPRPLAVSPLAGLMVAGAAAIALIVAARSMPLPELHRPAGAAAAARTASDLRTVRFVLAAPGAADVALVGDFNGWDAAATRLQPVGSGGVWTVEVPLTPGRHEYAFVVDGHEWRPDPAAPRAVTEDYGSPNSVITVEAQS